MADVLLVRPADSPGYTRFVLADPVGHPQAGVVVTAETDGGPFEIILHGQDRFDVPGEVESIAFPDGSAWTSS
jgi:hypothetical protein